MEKKIFSLFSRFFNSMKKLIVVEIRFLLNINCLLIVNY